MGYAGMAATTGLGHRGQRTIFDADDTDWEHTFTDIFLAHWCMLAGLFFRSSRRAAVG